MTDEQNQINENTKNIAELTAIAKNTSKDVEKLVNQFEKLIPVHEMIKNLDLKIDELKKDIDDGIKPKTLKNLLVITFSIVISFGTWTVLNIFNIKKDVDLHTTLGEEHERMLLDRLGDIDKNIEDNRNQITYNKGRITSVYKNKE